MKVSLKVEKLVTIEFREEELQFIIDILNSSDISSAHNLATVLEDSLMEGT